MLVVLLSLTALAEDRPEPRAVLDDVVLPTPHRVVLLSQLLNDGPVRRRVVSDDADLVLFYGGEQGGSMDTCGCPERPRGGLARTDFYVERSRRANPNTPSLLVNVGHWLDDTIGVDGELRPDVVLANDRMIDGLHRGGWDVLNVGAEDLAHIEAHGVPDEAVGASWPGREDLPSVQRFDLDGIEVVVVGVSGAGEAFLQPTTVEHRAPAEAVAAAIEGVDASAIVVVLGVELGRAASDVADVEGVDVFIEGDSYQERYEPDQVGEAVWTRTHYQTQRLGELRLWIDDGRVDKALDRKIDLDARVRSTGSLRRYAERTRSDINALQIEVFSSW